MVYINDPHLVFQSGDEKPHGKQAQRQPTLNLRFSPENRYSADPMLEVALPDALHSTEDLIITAFTAFFGGDPTPTTTGEYSVIFGHGEGVPLARDASNRLGCKPFASSYSGEALLVHRGDCTFIEKLQHAHAAGASGVIAISNADNGLNPTAKLDEQNAAGDGLLDVALVVVRKTDGELLERVVERAEKAGTRTWMVVEPMGSTAGPEEHTEGPSETLANEEAVSRILYLNGHALLNTRLLV
jgi:ER degradation enhancer, mannosidase alpha-like 1